MINSNNCIIISISYMKMWRVMAIGKHCYDNTAESTYFSHLYFGLMEVCCKSMN